MIILSFRCYFGIHWASISFQEDQKGAIVILMLFVLQAVPSCLLNMNPLHPRERDYAFAGARISWWPSGRMGLLMLKESAETWDSPWQYYSFRSCCVYCVCPVLIMAIEDGTITIRSHTTLHKHCTTPLLSFKPNAILFIQHRGDNEPFLCGSCRK